jgi:hypothetical protein
MASLLNAVKEASTGRIVRYKDMWYFRWTLESFVKAPIRIARFWSHPIRYPYVLGATLYAVGIYSITPSEEVKSKSAFIHKQEWVKADNEQRQEAAFAKRYAELQLEKAVHATSGHGHH